MSKVKPTNVVASIRARVPAIAKRNGEELEQLLTRYCVERFLCRLGSSPHAGRFLLKGAMRFVVWEGQVRRPTRDVDLLGFGALAPENRTNASSMGRRCREMNPEGDRGTEPQMDADKQL